MNSANQTPVIELKNTSRSFGCQKILRDISIKIHQGETVALIGESGCGKSVTMKLMMSLLLPDQGNVYWNGKHISEQSDKDLSRERLRFGYLFQGAALFDSMTVFENIAFGLRQNTKMSDKEIKDIVQEKIRDVGLTVSVKNKKPAELSGGMKKRVGLARALAMSPEVMFYDEPTTGLDPIMSDVINELIIQTRQQRQVTSVIVTHDMKTVQKVADRVIMLYPLSRLSEGEPQIIFEGTTKEAFQTNDPRVSQFITGEARERLQELMEV